MTASKQDAARLGKLVSRLRRSAEIQREFETNILGRPATTDRAELMLEAADSITELLELRSKREAEGERVKAVAWRYYDDYERGWSYDEQAHTDWQPLYPEAALVPSPQEGGQMRGEGAWQPIETAPHACHVIAARWVEAEWVYAIKMSPPSKRLWTHWQPLPAPPHPATQSPENEG
jgi:hypothetical protein